MKLKQIICLFTFIFLNFFNHLSAHEIKPAIVEFNKVKNQINIVLKFNAEAFLANIDASDYKETINFSNSIKYSELRLLPREILKEKVFESRDQIINSIFYPRKYHESDKKDIIIPTGKDQIAIRLFLKDKSFPTILFFHGNAEICKDYDDIGEIYNSFNINFIVSDYRGYGLSSGVPNKNNLHDDSLTVFDYTFNYLCKNKYKSNIFT